MTVPSRGTNRVRRRIFACLMAGFLVAPFLPLECTAIFTAVVWSFSGLWYASGLVAIGTFFRADSFTIYSGTERLMVRLLPLPSWSAGAMTVTVMFLGNLAAAYALKAVIRRRLLRRLPLAYFLP